MGTVIHDAVVITGWEDRWLEKARKRARKLKLCVSDVVPGRMNGYASILVAPDGSKEGWEDSNECNEARKLLVEWLRRKREHFEWVHVRYGHDLGNAEVADHNIEPFQP